jgi:hypothetical protein
VVRLVHTKSDHGALAVQHAGRTNSLVRPDEVYWPNADLAARFLMIDASD